MQTIKFILFLLAGFSPAGAVELGSLATGEDALVAYSGYAGSLRSPLKPNVDIRLEAVPEDEIARFREINAKPARNGPRPAPYAVAFPRPLPEKAVLPGLLAQKWKCLPEGGCVAQIRLTSNGAAALRAEIRFDRLDEGVELRFIGSDEPAKVLGPLTARQIRQQNLSYWTPITEGESLTLEIYLPSTTGPDALQGEITRLSHFIDHPAKLPKPGMVKPGYAGSQSCEVDVSCLNNASLSTHANSVARMYFTVDGSTFVCSGTLLNNTRMDLTPYFYTAAHCISTQAEADSLVTYWFYEAAACNSTVVSSGAVQRFNGGTLLYANSTDTEASLLRLNDAPPSGVMFSGWDSSAISVGTQVTGIHHPEGDVKKVSTGNVTNIGLSFILAETDVLYTGFTEAFWTSGVVEHGSSGSGLFSGSGNQYRLRGSLTSGDGSCQEAPRTGVYSPFDRVYPAIAQYLSPSDTGSEVAEFYNTKLIHFFITANSAEAAAIDNGSAGPGWIRTGNTFKSGGSNAVCRFYGSQQPGPNSHFYTADAAECASLKQIQVSIPDTQKRWNYEGLDFVTSVPVNGACFTGTMPVYRAYNNGFSRGIDSNHRITTSLDAIQDVVNLGWVNEGVVMCAPI
ncbi:MAG: trypsin-like serine protease [Sulfuricellaceae bacterium]|nr:trypsin-like serine protease [Sulfuricellaceae bacterium]